MFSLGGSVVALEGDDVASLLHHDAFDRFAVADGVPEWTVRLGCPVDAPPEDSLLLSDFEYSEVSSRCLFSRSGDDYFFSMLSAVDDSVLLTMRHRRGSSLVESTAVDNRDALRFALWFAVSMLTLPSMRTFVHSSTVVCRRRAVMFLGESGTGKSTHSRLWLKNIEGSRLLNDDSPLIELRTIDAKLALEHSLKTQRMVIAHGTPWSGKTPCYVPFCFPVAAIVRLSQAPHNRIRRLSVPEAFAALQPSLPPALAQDDYYADLLVEILSGTISNVPVYHLECLPDADAARLCYKTVFHLS